MEKSIRVYSGAFKAKVVSEAFKPKGDYLLMDEGRINKLYRGYVYEYHLKDHLGNVRFTIQPNGTGKTLTQATEYYPFGMNYCAAFPLHLTGF